MVCLGGEKTQGPMKDQKVLKKNHPVAPVRLLCMGC